MHRDVCGRGRNRSECMPRMRCHHASQCIQLMGVCVIGENKHGRRRVLTAKCFLHTEETSTCKCDENSIRTRVERVYKYILHRGNSHVSDGARGGESTAAAAVGDAPGGDTVKDVHDDSRVR